MSSNNEVEAAALDWIGRFAAALGIPAPEQADVVALLDLAGIAAHSSHRQAAPVACFLAAQSGLSPTAALAVARELPG